MVARSPDPPWAARFVLSVDDLEIGTFTEVSGLAVSIEVEELAEGGQNQFTHKLLGRMTWPNLVLKRGITDSDALFSWLTSCSGEGFTGSGNKIKPRDGEVRLLDPSGEPARTWQFTGARPVRWAGPTFAASATDLAVEELELAHHGFQTS